MEKEAVEQQLERIASSERLRRCPQLLRFLAFTVKEALSGRSDGSKERLIGIEVFGRAPDYDAGADPVVRVEARRLRRKLTEYYESEGREDAIEIDLPKGGYQPQFTRRARRCSTQSLAVLPFVDRSEHAKLSKLCDGLTVRLMTCDAIRGKKRFPYDFGIRSNRGAAHNAELRLVIEYVGLETAAKGKEITSCPKKRHADYTNEPGWDRS